ncbi:restriction endonuclease subunit S [Legionella bozemanae]|uniref:restriction endonuclease subunit S n=1 Tax=Legionella bozemanae TaxID=447 RepID=UPI001041A3CF|nr:restriction endonuclease subunit S [Legionella bozemanae]
MVPKGWEKHSIGELCLSIVPGRNKPRIFTGNIPWVTIPEIKGRYIPSNLQKNYVCKSEIKAVGAKIVPEGGVIIAAVGDFGLTAIASEPVVLNQQLHAFICKENIYNEYLAYWLETQRPYMKSIASKTTIPYMNKANCESIPVLVPPMSEQKKIAKILSTWDKAITTTEKLLANSEQQKKALMQQLLTRKKRFHKFNKEWIDVHLSDISNIVMGTSPSSRSYNENNLGLPLIQGNADILNRKSSPRIFTSEITKECTVGDILLSVRAPVGTVAISQHRACIGRGIASIKAKKDFNQEFLYQWFLWFEPKWGMLSQGSTFESISSGDIKSLKLLIPDLEEQQKIAVVLSTTDREIKNIKQELNCLKQEKKALMQHLLTGKKRVKVAEINNA